MLRLLQPTDERASDQMNYTYIDLIGGPFCGLCFYGSGFPGSLYEQTIGNVTHTYKCDGGFKAYYIGAKIK